MKKKEKSFWEILKERLSPEVLKELLLLEKKRRGVEENRLVFIGTADVAQYWWCGMKSLFRNREMELAFFSAYLEDRILYSYELGLINQLPPDNESLLDIGNEITFQDIEKLLKKRAEEGIVKSYLLNPIPPPQNQEEAEEMSAEIPPEDWEIELPGLLEEGGGEPMFFTLSFLRKSRRN